MSRVHPFQVFVWAVLVLSALLVVPATAAALDGSPPRVYLQADPAVADNGPFGYGVWSTKSVFLEVVASDPESGVSKIEHAIAVPDSEEFVWLEGSKFSVADEGVWWAVARATNGDGVTGVFLADDLAPKLWTGEWVSIDRTVPTTVASGAVSGHWYGTPVTVTLAASDGAGGSGFLITEYRLDASGWTAGSDVPVSAQGKHTLRYRSSDLANNMEAGKTLTFGIDTRRPKTKAPYAAGAARGAIATLKYKVADPRPGSPTAEVTIKVMNRSGKLVKTLGPYAGRAVNTLLSARFTVPRSWSAGAYRFAVSAKDKAGNTQVLPAGSNRLVVR
ncbi:MAG TPA: hypothetical protein VFZ86_10580 [Thermoleophilia bacterium]|nr:hypothetical protein [Thermoleophilia bacterium]